MEEQFENFAANLTEFLLFFVVAAILTTIFVVVYTRITKHNEISLIKNGSTSTALAFSGSLIGFALPVASTMISSNTVVELALWGLVALVVQILAYFLIRLPMPRISARIESGEVAAGIWLGAGSLVAGILNAASMTN